MKRLQFDFPEERVRELDGLVTRSGLKTRAQLFNSALTFFEWAVRERSSGRIIASMDERAGQYKEIEMPEFPAIPDSQAQASEPEKEFEDLLLDTAKRVDSPDQAAWLRNLAQALSRQLDAAAIALQLNQLPLAPVQSQAKAATTPGKARAGRSAPAKKVTGGAKAYSLERVTGRKRSSRSSKKTSGSAAYRDVEVEE